MAKEKALRGSERGRLAIVPKMFQHLNNWHGHSSVYQLISSMTFIVFQSFWTLNFVPGRHHEKACV